MPFIEISVIRLTTEAKIILLTVILSSLKPCYDGSLLLYSGCLKLGAV